MNRRQALSAIAAAAVVTPVSVRAEAARAMTTNGPVQGVRTGGVTVFKGIPYGQSARFMPPARPQAWREPFVADRYGPACPQGKIDASVSEDCLTLNVWTPRADTAARPVMVYFHGGAYSSGWGNDPLYDGTNLALRGDVVVVTVTHRLNVFGYLYLARMERAATGESSLASSGNAGQLDLILALQWVRDNIAAFGGDPGKVMVFGQSGGGAKIATLMATPAAEGLFHRAATMSGQQVTASGPGNATLRATAFLKTLGLAADADGLAKVQTLPADELVAALKATTDPVLGGGLYMGPVLDETVLFRHPFYPEAAQQGLSIPMMIGNTHDETRGFLGGDAHNFALTWDELPGKLPKEYRVDIDPYLVIDTYRRLYPQMSPSEVFFAATTAGRSWRGAIIEAEERAKAGAPAFVYQFDWPTPKDGGKLGAPHTIDIPLVFRNTAVPGALTGDGDEARRMADFMSDAFIAFARAGSPQTQALPAWAPYSMDKRETMVMNLPPVLANDPRGEERKLFEKVPFIQAGT